ncbi:MAG: helix-turn-helix domain-containing protein [Hyphomicrobiales bacterium]|nr:helix-turn-helix domain-containing protein [Hyphomicrobiales bacterium]
MDNSAVRVLFVVLPDSLALDWAGPAEALRIANGVLAEQGRAPAFKLEFVGPEPNPPTSVGVRLCEIAPLPSLSGDANPPVWIVLLGQPGPSVNVSTPAARRLLGWLRDIRLVPGYCELVCVCAGSILAAHAGLLDGLEATTHHHHLEELRTVAPRCRVVANRVFIAGKAIHTSAGVTTGVDLMLHRIAEHCGSLVAARVAEIMAVALRRGPADPELSPFLAHRGHLHLQLHRLQDAICRQPQGDWTLASMAKIACVSPRHLGRLFALQAGITPLHYLQRIRLNTAEAALRAGARVGQAAALAGFTSEAQLRRAWVRLGATGTTPSSALRRAGATVRTCPSDQRGDRRS